MLDREASLILVPLVSMIVPSHHPGKMQVLVIKPMCAHAI